MPRVLHLSLIFMPAWLIGCPGNDDTGASLGTCADPGVSAVIGGIAYEVVDGAFANVETGQEIQLCNDIIMAEDTLIIDKDITVVGSGAGRSVLVAPTNEAAIEINGTTNARVEGFTIRSSRSGLEITEATVELADLEFDNVANYGIDALDSTIVASSLEFVVQPSANAPETWGGIRILGGSLDLSDSVFINNYDFGILARQNAEVTVTGTQFAGTRFTGEGTELNGFGIDGQENATIISEGNTFEANVVGGIHIEAASLTSTNDVFTGNYSGMWIDRPVSVQATGTDIQDSVQYGLVLLSVQNGSFDGLNIALDPETSLQHIIDDPATLDVDETQEGSYGIIGLDSQITLANGSISGANEAGVYLTTQVSQGSSLTMSDMVIDNNGMLGVLMSIGSADFDNVTISNTRDNDEACMGTGGVSCNFGMFAIEADVEWLGGGLVGNETHGIVVLQGSLDAEDILVNNQGEAGLYVASSALTGTELTFDAAGANGIYQDGGVVTLVDPTFQNGTYTRTYEWSDGSSTVYNNEGIDIFQAFGGGGQVIIQGGTFTGGDRLFDGGGGDLEMFDAVVSDYHQRAIDLSTGSATIANTTFTNNDGYAIYCSSGDVDLEDVDFDTINAYQSLSQDFDVDGNLLFESSFTSATPALFGSSCDFVLEDVTISNTWDTAIELSSGTVEMDGIEILNATQGVSTPDAALNIATSTAADILLNDVQIQQVVGGPGLKITGIADSSDEIELVDIRVGGTAPSDINGNGVHIANVGSALISGLEVDNTVGAGLLIENALSLQVDGTASGQGTINNAGTTGIDMRGASTVASLLNLRVVNAVGDGVQLNDGTHSLSQVSIETPGGHGVVAQSAAADLGTGFTWDGTNTVLATNTSNVAVGDTIRLGTAGEWFEVVSVVDGVSVDIDDAGLTVPTSDGSTATQKAGTGPTTTLSNVTVTGAGADGLWLQSGSHNLTTVTVTGATDYGMSCELPAAFPICDTVSSDGGLGATDVCPCP